MNHTRIFTVAAGLSGVAAIALGTYGAHGLKFGSDAMKDTWKTASLYHLLHTVALAVTATSLHGKKQKAVGYLFLTGITLFCGACYSVVLLNDKSYGKAAPFGGISLMLGWLCFAVM